MDMQITFQDTIVSLGSISPTGTVSPTMISRLIKEVGTDGQVAWTAEVQVKRYELKGIPFEFVKIEPGTFLGFDGKEATIDKPRWMCTTTVTQELWSAVMGINPSNNKGDKNNKHPVESISFWEMLDFCNELNCMMGLPEPYNVIPEVTFEHNTGAEDSFKLPDAMLWEYACKGGQHSRGFKYAGGDDPLQVGWFYENSNGETHPVAQKKPNELGIYDMNGNVWESTHTVVN